jgi:hypothetical protein
MMMSFAALPTQVPLSQLSPLAWVAIGALLVFTLVMYVVSLMDLYRRPVEQILGGRKWVWLLVILLINSGIGAIIYLLAGRKPAPAAEGRPTTPAAERADAAADALYGSPKDGGER